MRGAILLLSIFSIHKGEEWIPLFDGTTLEGWQANDNAGSWTVKDGALRGEGNASYLFYRDLKCVNCEIEADVRINHGGVSGMYMRAPWAPGTPQGYKAQIDNAPTDPSRTGSLSGFVSPLVEPIPDDTWWTEHIIVEGNHIQIQINGKKTVDFVDEKNTYAAGYLALEQHGAGSVVEFKNVRMRVLPGPTTQLSGIWKLNREQSKLAPGTPAETEIRILDERSGLRWQAVQENNTLEANVFLRPDGYDYRVTGSPLYDHVAIQEVDKHLVHFALREAKVRKKLDPHTFVAEMKEGRNPAARIVYTISPDGKTMTAEGSWKHGASENTPYKEVFERVE